ncbi:MAG: sulfotransferase [Phycisphaerales bacterium]|nr:sulfotransferase [Phycisphaerales bacterium]
MAKRPPPGPAQQLLAALGERAMRALGAGDLDRAEALANEALAAAPGLGPALAVRASVGVRRRRYEQAERDILAAMRTQPTPPAQWVVTLSQVYRGRGELDRAMGLLRDALARDPGAQILTSNLGELLITTRCIEEAYELLAGAVARGADRPGLLAQYGRVCRATGRAGDAVGPLERAAADPGQPASGRQQALFELGMVLDTLGRYDGAFGAFRGANALEARGYDIEGQSRAVDDILREWTADRVAALPQEAGAGAGAGAGLVFIVGMRRSGTTLTEQVLGAHPSVRAGGELAWLREAARALDPEPGNRYGLVTDLSRCTPEAVGAASRSYLERADTAREGRPVFTDKMPANLKLLSLVQLALPGARVVWCRREPVETCLSCYMQPFNDNSYCADLVTLARYHHDCERLMDHWRRVLTLPIFELHHESLLAEPEPVLRRLLGFLGLPYHDACLHFERSGQISLTRSTDQVARGLAPQAARRAEHYHAHLGPLREELERLARGRPGEG